MKANKVLQMKNNTRTVMKNKRRMMDTRMIFMQKNQARKKLLAVPKVKAVQKEKVLPENILVNKVLVQGREQEKALKMKKLLLLQWLQN